MNYITMSELEATCMLESPKVKEIVLYNRELLATLPARLEVEGHVFARCIMTCEICGREEYYTMPYESFFWCCFCLKITAFKATHRIVRSPLLLTGHNP